MMWLAGGMLGAPTLGLHALARSKPGVLHRQQLGKKALPNDPFSGKTQVISPSRSLICK
jgi:hypothetical protein